MTNFWKGKRVLVTGSEGLIGKELCKLLTELEAEVTRFDIKLGQNVMKISDCDDYCLGVDYVFHLFGIKGNPTRTKNQPIDFMWPMIIGDLNMIRAAWANKVKRFLYTSSIAVENPETDWYPAWAKRTGEEFCKATMVQYPNETKYVIVRPANVYGYEDLNNENLMVVSNLIKQGLTNKKLVLDIEGSKQIRDLIYTKDVALGMIKAVEEMPGTVNLCSSKEVSIKQIAEVIAEQLNIPIEYKNLNMILGPNRKVMGNPYITPQITLQEGIKDILFKLKDKP